jgi:hypothetical protein
MTSYQPRSCQCGKSANMGEWLYPDMNITLRIHRPFRGRDAAPPRERVRRPRALTDIWSGG